MDCWLDEKVLQSDVWIEIIPVDLEENEFVVGIEKEDEEEIFLEPTWIEYENKSLTLKIKFGWYLVPWKEVYLKGSNSTTSQFLTISPFFAFHDFTW